ncbi:MAG: DNA mismatch repair endonuclease MutL [Christensenellales bacterium]
MGKIVLLDDSTINKIAAGEVIERPASVVKEIVENSIDAGATNITVEIKNGGISYIRVTDNGKGIMQDDMEIAFERHATSKIRSADDLDDVKSMGFRGEALASIAEIAKVELISKTAQSDNGYRVLIEGGKVLESSEYGCPNGTTITIENLFFNTPVRYKFLKKDFTESGYIEDVITRIALVHPEIAIRLVNTGKTIVQTSGNGDLKSVIYNIYGKDIAENLINIDYEYEGMRVSGVIGKPVISRSNRTNQLFFVNKRYVKDKTLSGAAEQGFKGFITIGKHGFLILNIDMDPHLVDVNVHPAKLEVRFQEDNKVFKAVYHAIKDGLSNVDLVANTSSIDGIDHPEKNNNEKPETFNFLNNTSFRDAIKPIERTSEIKSQVANSVDEKFEDVMSRINKIQNMINITNKVEPKTETTEAQIPEEKIVENKTYETQNSAINLENTKSEDAEKIDETQFMDMYEKMFGTAVKKNEVSEKVEDEVKEFQPITKNDNISVFEDNTEYKLQPEYKYIGIAFNTYIIIEIKQDLYIIDQHAAHERIMYEKIKKNYYNENDKDSQLMLLPDIITLTNKEMGIYKDNREMFRKAGFMVDEFGENTIKLSGVPTILLDLETKELFLEALDEINTVARTARQEIEEKFIATVACKAAVKAHMVLERQEVEALLNELLVLPNPFTCPHGRPTAIRMTKNDIEKKFSRR